MVFDFFSLSTVFFFYRCQDCHQQWQTHSLYSSDPGGAGYRATSRWSGSMSKAVYSFWHYESPYMGIKRSPALLVCKDSKTNSNVKTGCMTNKHIHRKTRSGGFHAKQGPSVATTKSIKYNYTIPYISIYPWDDGAEQPRGRRPILFWHDC